MKPMKIALVLALVWGIGAYGQAQKNQAALTVIRAGMLID